MRADKQVAVWRASAQLLKLEKVLLFACKLVHAEEGAAGVKAHPGSLEVDDAVIAEEPELALFIMVVVWHSRHDD